MVIVNPDILISATTIANSFECTRKAVLQSKVKSSSEYNHYPLITGRIIHECFQAALLENNFETDWLRKKFKQIVESSLEDLYQAGKNERQLCAELNESIPFIQKWKTDNTKKFNLNDSIPAHKLMVTDVLDVEERIWSRKYGIKGNIDVTLKMSSSNSHKIVPLELKTGIGSANVAHRSQVMLYTFLLSDKHNKSITDGMLSYLNGNGTSFISTRPEEKIAILQQRNLLGTYLCTEQLPPVIKNHDVCKRCFVSDACFIYHKIFEKGDSESSGVGTLFESLTSHLNEKDNEFFTKWENVIAMEEKKSNQISHKDIWTVSVEERERSGKCLSNLIIIEENGINENKDSFIYTLRKVENPNSSFFDSQFTEGASIIVTNSNSPYSPVGVGFVQLITSKTITISVDRALFVKNSAKSRPLFVLDIHGFNGKMGILRDNLLQMFKVNTKQKTQHLRSLVVSLDSPRFDPIVDVREIKQCLLNDSQKNCIAKILSGILY